MAATVTAQSLLHMQIMSNVKIKKKLTILGDFKS